MTTPAIAINIALLPDQTMAAEAKRVNTAMLQNYAEGFALDARHTPHITLLQAFVSRENLGDVYSNVEQIEVDDELETEGFDFHDGGALGVGGFVVSRPAWLLRAHCEVVAAVAPFTLPVGGSNAFVTSPEEPTISDATIDYVKNFTASRTGENYHPHLSVGIARTAFLAEFKRSYEKKFAFGNEGLAVYQLGNFGTCQRLLYRP